MERKMCSCCKVRLVKVESYLIQKPFYKADCSASIFTKRKNQKDFFFFTKTEEEKELLTIKERWIIHW
jgi:hypothetical protein